MDNLWREQDDEWELAYSTGDDIGHGVVLAFQGDKVFAHVPRIVDSEGVVSVDGAEVSQAFYVDGSIASGEFLICEEDAFLLYISLLLPDVVGVSTDIGARLYRVDPAGEPHTLAILDGSAHAWSPFFEPFGGDTYLKGPEFRRSLPGGDYRVKVYGGAEKYVLTVGEREVFTGPETLNTLRTLRLLKRDFFGRSAFTALLSVVGATVLVVLAGIIGGFYGTDGSLPRAGSVGLRGGVDGIDRVATYYLRVRDSIGRHLGELGGRDARVEYLVRLPREYGKRGNSFGYVLPDAYRTGVFVPTLSATFGTAGLFFRPPGAPVVT